MTLSKPSLLLPYLVIYFLLKMFLGFSWSPEKRWVTFLTLLYVNDATVHSSNGSFLFLNIYFALIFESFLCQIWFQFVLFLSFWLRPLVSASIVWVLVGRWSLTQCLFSFCFRGEVAASPLNSRRRWPGRGVIFIPHIDTNVCSLTETL